MCVAMQALVFVGFDRRGGQWRGGLSNAGVEGERRKGVIAAPPHAFTSKHISTCTWHTKKGII